MMHKLSGLKVGVFVLIAIIIVISTLFWAKGFFLYKNQRDMKAYFTSINGLNVGDPVSVNGVKSGKVMEIDLVEDSVLVNFSLDQSVKLKTDYIIEVAILELMGGKQLFITPGKASAEISYDKPLIGNSSADMLAILKNVTDMSADVKTLISKLGNTNDNLNKVLNNVNDIVGDGNLKSDLKGTFSNLQRTSVNLNSLVSENRVSIKGLTDKIGNTVDNVNGLVDVNNPKIKSTFENMNSLSLRVDSLVGNLNLIVSDIQSKKSGIGKFISDDKFFDNMNKTLDELEKLTRQIRKEGFKINLF